MPTDEQQDQVCARQITPPLAGWLAYSLGIPAGHLLTTGQLSPFALVVVS